MADLKKFFLEGRGKENLANDAKCFSKERFKLYMVKFARVGERYARNSIKAD